MVCPCVALPFLVGGAAGASLRKSQVYVLIFSLLTIVVLIMTYRRLDENCSKCTAF